jgi:hypothetical protein
MLIAAVLQEIAHQSVSTGRPWDVTHRTYRRSPQRRAASVRTVLYQPAQAPVDLVVFGDEGDAIVETSIAQIAHGPWPNSPPIMKLLRASTTIRNGSSPKEEWEARGGDVHQQRPSSRRETCPSLYFFFVALISTFLLPDPSPISGSSSPTTPRKPPWRADTKHTKQTKQSQTVPAGRKTILTGSG